MDLKDELAGIVADLRAWVEVEWLSGARLLPIDAVVPAHEGHEREMPLPNQPARKNEKRERVPPQRLSEKMRAPSEPKAPSSTPVEVGPGKWGHLLNQESPADALGVGEQAPSSGAEKAQTMNEVRAVLGDCQRCGLCASRNRLVFGDGPDRARLMVIGEAPGHHEDRQGVPFVGKAGQMLDNMLRHVLGLERSEVFVTNVVKCRPPNNRNPEPDEIAKCLPVLKEQVRILKPDLVLVLGSVACRALFGPNAGVTRIRGQWQSIEFSGGTVRAMPTFHPAYLLRKPDDKRLSFADLKTLKTALDNADG